VTSPALLAEARASVGDIARLDTPRRNSPQRDGGDAEALIEQALDEATAPVIALPSGGRISIGQMAAVTAIDVDSGTGSPEAANAEAVTAIARAIRLRGIGGQMVVDFIPSGGGKSGGKSSIAKWAAALKRALGKDPVATTVLGTTPMGLVEVTRERRGPSIPELLLEAPLPRLSALSLGLNALARAAAAQNHHPGRALTLRLPPAAETALRVEKTALAEARALIPVGLTLKTDPTLAPDSFAIEAAAP
jgi:ribonuclease E/ribonuclease G